MFGNVSYVVRFYRGEELDSEIWHNSISDAFEHFRMFDDTDGYNMIELVEIDWYARRESVIESETF